MPGKRRVSFIEPMLGRWLDGRQNDKLSLAEARAGRSIRIYGMDA